MILGFNFQNNILVFQKMQIYFLKGEISDKKYWKILQYN